jgi:hypothetical protein
MHNKVNSSIADHITDDHDVYYSKCVTTKRSLFRMAFEKPTIILRYTLQAGCDKIRKKAI